MRTANSGITVKRGGFTLIELLVSISILIVLTTLAVGTFRLGIGNERVSAASRMLQAKFEGARSRAYGKSQIEGRPVPVGIRFVLDETTPNLVTGFQYIQGTIDDNPRGKLRFVDLTPTVAGTVQGIQYRGAYDNDSRSWVDLANSGLLQAGVKIIIDDVRYTISSERFLPSVYNNETLKLVENVPGVTRLADPTPANQNLGNTGQGGTYELDVSTIAFPMPGEDIQSFPPGTVIDLANSKVPDSWKRIFAWSSGNNYLLGDWIIVQTSNGLRFGNAIAAGISGGTLPDLSGAFLSAVPDGGVTWRIHGSLNLDIMFSPQGGLLGPLVAEGVFHFLLAERIDTDAGIDIRVPANLDKIRGSYRVITIYTRSGNINVSEANLNDDNLNGNIEDSELFRFAIEGTSAK